jgi:hypothetical protein
MTDIHKIIGGAVAGGVAPLATYAANAFAAGDNVILTSLPLGLILVFAIIGAVTAFFTATTRMTVFTAGVAGPFIILAIIQTKDLAKSKGNEATAIQAAVDAETAAAQPERAANLVPEEISALTSPTPEL